jgi:WD40 repeat protein
MQKKQFLFSALFICMIWKTLWAGGITDIAFSPNGENLAPATTYNTRLNSPSIKIRNVETGNLIKTLRLDSGITSVADSPNGQYIIGGCLNGNVIIWDIDNGQLKTINAFPGEVHSVDFNQNGEQFAAGGEEGVKIFNASSGQELRTLPNSHGSDIIAYSPDGKRLASGTNENIIKIWDTENGREIMSLSGHTDFIFSLAYSPDGQHLASGSQDGVVKIWNVLSGQLIRTISVFQNARQNTRQVSGLSWITTSIVFVSSSVNALEIWDIENNKRLVSNESGPLATVTSNKNKNIIIAGERSMTLPAADSIYIFDLNTGNIIRTLHHMQD